MTLNPRTKYLQIAFNRDKNIVSNMVRSLPKSENLILEAGTTFVKEYGTESITILKNTYYNQHRQDIYCVADLKSMDRAEREVKEFASVGANAITCLGLAPIETIDLFIEECAKNNIDSIIDMINVPYPFEITQKFKKLPKILLLHRGVDEGHNKEKPMPYKEIHRIKGTYNNLMIAIAGGENQREVRRTFFNDADISIVWKELAENSNYTKSIVENYLKFTK